MQVIRKEDSKSKYVLFLPSVNYSLNCTVPMERVGQVPPGFYTRTSDSKGSHAHSAVFQQTQHPQLAHGTRIYYQAPEQIHQVVHMGKGGILVTGPAERARSLDPKRYVHGTNDPREY